MEESPYQSPETDHLTKSTDPYYPKVLTTQGRIGRARYMCYYTWLTFAIVMVGSVVAGLVAVFLSGLDEERMMGFAMLFGFGLYIPIIILFFVLAKRRLNDMGTSGWLSLLMLLPFVNFIFALALIFWPGTKGANRYGPPPAENSAAVIIFGIVFPALGFILMLLALFLPIFLGDTSWLGGLEG